MSASWMGYFFDETDLKDSQLLLALAIADHANSEGVSFPGTTLLSKKIRKSPRQTKLLIKQLEEAGYMEIIRGSGRKHYSRYQLRKVLPVAPLKEPEKVTSSSHPLADEKGVADSTNTEPKGCYEPHEKGVTERQEKVLPSDSAPIEPFLEPSEEKRGPKPTDLRSQHPAIVAIREIAEIFPPKAIWDALIEALGDAPDGVKLLECWVAWRACGFKPVNYAWALNWYRNGTPPEYRMNGNGRKPQNGLYIGQHLEDANVSPAVVPIEKECKPARPPAECPAEERELWEFLLRKLSKHMNTDVFNTWFRPIIFDGLNDEKNAFMIRCGKVIHDWVTHQYSQMIDETLTEMDIGEFTLCWEIEDSEIEQAA